MTSAFHFHGRLADDRTGTMLGATLAQVERGLPDDVRTTLDAMLLAPEARLVIFIGYSGSDFFGIDPYLHRLATTDLRGKTFLWLEHDQHAVDLYSGDGAASRRRQLRWLQDGGASVLLLRAPTRSAVGSLAVHWQLSPPPGELSGYATRPWRPRNRIEGPQEASSVVRPISLDGPPPRSRTIAGQNGTAAYCERLARAGRYTLGARPQTRGPRCLATSPRWTSTR